MKYFSINHKGEVYENACLYDNIDAMLYEFGNFFLTREEAEKNKKSVLDKYKETFKKMRNLK